MVIYKQHWLIVGVFHILLFTRLADEQGTDEARVVVLHNILVGDVAVGEAGGVVWLRGNI